ncbi:MAG: DedA family protein, partial [Acidobacteria bacterium]|nr:DedA family protein [Acidobacteriota bacterium]
MLMFLIAYIENIFPPAPSDMLLVFAGTMIGFGTIDFTSALIAATLGSTVGFVSAYLLGRYFERHIIEGRVGRYLPTGSIQQVEGLFRRFGYGVIVANRFLAGTRAIVSFFAGMSRMSLPRTTVLSAVSAGAWNTLLLLLGEVFASNWQRVASYLQVYSAIVTGIVVLALAVWLWQYLRRRRQCRLHG